MVAIPSPNRQSGAVAGSVPSNDPNYPHPAERREPKGIPLMFQVTSPFDRRTVLLPHALVMHVNPQSFEENHLQKKEVIQTRGGFVEQHWGHELVEISASGSTGAFMNIRTGLSSIVRQQTIAWDRYRDLVELYYNNGSVHDPYGNVVLQGHIMLLYDRGVYLGTFRSFETTETDESPFAFQTSWTFKVDRPILRIPTNIFRSVPRVPGFQNIVPSQRRTEREQALEAIQAANVERQALLEEQQAFNRDLGQRARENAARVLRAEAASVGNDPQRAATLSAIALAAQDGADDIAQQRTAETNAETGELEFQQESEYGIRKPQERD